MDFRRIKQLLWLLCVVLLVVGSLATWTLLTMPFDQAEGKSLHVRYGSGYTGDTRQTLPELQNFSRVWDLNLRRPLYDPPPPPPPQVETPAPPTIDFDLAGIVLDGDNSQVIAIQKDGSILILSVGDAIGSTKLLSIHEDRIEVDHFGEKRTLQMEGM